MAQSAIDICNSALTKIGAETIVGFNDNSKTSDACKLRYDSCKKAVLRLHPWNGCTKRTTLTPLATAPEFGFANAFLLPSDCLRVLEVNDQCVDYKIEGRNILCDDSTIQLKYIFDIGEDVTRIDELLCELIAHRLAWDICYKITQSSTLKAAMYADYKDALRTAKTPDAQEEPSEEVTADYFLESRLAGTESATPKRNWPS